MSGNKLSVSLSHMEITALYCSRKSNAQIIRQTRVCSIVFINDQLSDKSATAPSQHLISPPLRTRPRTHDNDKGSNLFHINSLILLHSLQLSAFGAVSGQLGKPV